MAVNLSETCRNNHLDNIEALLIAGGPPKLRLMTGSKPATCADAQTGTQVAELTLPADPFNTASAGVKTKLGAWSGMVSPGSATPVGYFRLLVNAGTTCILQGTVAVSAADLNLDNTVLAASQTLTITQFDLTAGNA